MKLIATIEVEFEASSATVPQNVLESALLRGLGGLRHQIEYGTTGQTNIKKGSAKCEVLTKTIVQ